MSKNRRIGGITALVGVCCLGVMATYAQERALMQHAIAQESADSDVVARISFPDGSREGGIAGTSCSQAPANCQAPDGANGLNSTAGAFRVAENLDVVTGGNITNVCWYGMYANGGTDCGATAVDAFVIKIYNDNNGIPAAAPSGTYTQGTNLVVTRSTTGVTLPFGAGLAEYNYSATLSGTLVNALAANCYWIEITNGVTACSWFWETGTGLGTTYLDAVQDADSAYANTDVVQTDMALCVNLALQNTAAQPCAPSAPANDTCATAAVIPTTGVQTIVDLRGSANDATPTFSCKTGGAGPGAGSVWYRFTATLTSHRINTCNSVGDDTLIAVYTGTCATLTEIACNDDDCGLLSDMVVSGLTVGTQYFVQLAAFSDVNRGVYAIEVGPPLSCQDHLPAGGYIIVPSNNGNTPIYDDFNANAASTLSRFEVTSIFWNGVNGAGANVTLPPTTADNLTLEIMTYDPNRLATEPPVATRSTTDASMTIVSRTGLGIGFDFNGASPGGFAEFQRYVLTFPPVNIGSGCHWFRIWNTLTGQPVQWWMLGGPRSVMDFGNGNAAWDGDGDGLQFGDLASYDWIWCFDTLNLVDPTSCIDTTPPVNDECTGALVIPCNAAGENRDVDLRNATASGADPTPSCVGAPLASSVWFRVTTGAVTPSLLIQTCNTNFVGVNDSAVAVFTAGPGGCPGDLVEVACANDNCGGAFYEQIRVDPALPNTQYFIMVGGVDEFSQLFYELDVTCPAPPRPANDACANAVALTSGVPVLGTTANSSVDANIAGLTPCNTVASDEPGVWYTFTNTGADATFEANLCSAATTAQDTVLTIWCGNDCNTLQCVTGNDDGAVCGGLESAVEWCAKQNAKYWIHVSKFPGSTEGPIEILINSIGTPCTPDPAGCPVSAACPGAAGDSNCSGAVDFFDIDPFLQALFDLPGYLAVNCGGSICAVDIDCSGAVDFFDIDPFLACIFGLPGCPGPLCP